jgi:hypothetical protein
MVDSFNIETESVNFSFEKDILYIVYKKDIDVKLAHIKDNVGIRKRIQKNDKLLLFVDFRDAWQISEDAKKFLGSKEVTDLNVAMALLVDDLNSMLIANFFVKFNKPASPTKIFNSKVKAIEWLESFK